MSAPTETTIGLVACAAAKLPHPAPARDLYVSQLFRKASAYAAATCDGWYILSAKHGLVHPDTIIEPHDLKLGSKGPSAPSIQQWAARVQDQLTAELTGLQNVKLIALAGEQYRTAIRDVPWSVEIPHEGPRHRPAARLADRTAVM